MISLLNKGAVQLALTMAAAGWTENEVAERVGAAQTTVNGWLHARYLPGNGKRTLLRDLTGGRVSLGSWNEPVTASETAAWEKAMRKRGSLRRHRAVVL